MTDWNRLDAREFSDAIATYEIAARDQGVDPGWLWRDTLQRISSSPEYCYASKERIAACAIELARSVSRNWPEPRQLTEAALALVNRLYRLPWSSLTIRSVLENGSDRTGIVGVVGDQRQFEVTYQFGPKHLTLVNISVSQLTAP
jgi:hypothetical protein